MAEKLEYVVDAPDDEEGESELQLGGFRVTLQPHDWTVSVIVDLMRNGRIDVSPGWQRRDAWDGVRRSQFIESLLLELPVPQIVLAERTDRPNHYVVIDGKQRLSTLRRFLALPGEQTASFPLHNLTILNQLEGLTLGEISQRGELQHFADQLQDSTIRTVVIRNWQRSDYLHFVFLRLNQGTLPLKPQELRQALIPGPFTEFVDQFSLDATALHAVMGAPGPDPRMQDTEVLVRFLGFRLFLTDYEGNLKAFLDGTCERLNESWRHDEAQIRDALAECLNAMNACQAIFGDQACRLWLNGRAQRSFNRAVFDTMAYYLSSPVTRAAAVNLGDAVRDSFVDLCRDDPEFLSACQQTTKTQRATFKRLKAWGEKLRGLGIPVEVPGFDDDNNRITL